MLPAWLASSTTVPTPVSVTLSPVTLAGPDLTESVTGNAELATGGVIAMGVLVKLCVPMVSNAAMVCESLPTVKLVVTCFAAAWVESPAWFASNVTVPAPVNVMVSPEIVAGLPALTVTVTGNPEFAVGGVIVKGA